MSIAVPMLSPDMYSAGGEYRATDRHVLVKDKFTSRVWPSPRPLCIGLHGANQNAHSFGMKVDVGGGGYLTRAIIKRGYDYLAVDAGGLFNFGNAYLATADDCGEALDEALDWALSVHGLRSDEDFVMVSASMGTLTVANWLRIGGHMDRCARWAPTLPAVNPQDVYDRNVFGSASFMDTAYPPNWAAHAPTYNPNLHRSDFADLDMKFFYSGDDPATPASFVESWMAELDKPGLRFSESAGHSWVGLDFDVLANYLTGLG